MQFFAIPNNGKGIAAQAATRGLHHRQGHSCGNGRVHRIATRFQQAQASLGGQWLRGADDVRSITAERADA